MVEKYTIVKIELMSINEISKILSLEQDGCTVRYEESSKMNWHAHAMCSL
jgi:hypothetical protein